MYICLYDKYLNRDNIVNEYINVLNKNKIIVFNSKSKDFTDLEGNNVDLSSSVVFPINGINQVKEMINVLESKNIQSFISSEDINKISNWTNYYKPQRKTSNYSGGELCLDETIELIEKEYGDEFFFKTKEKDYSALVKTVYLKNKESILFKALEKHNNKNFIISDYVDIQTDEIGNLEYRCVVVNGKVRNISRQTENVVHKIDKKIKDKCDEVVNKLLNSDFPASYVVDLMVYKNHDNNEVIDVVEFNELSSSGMYLYNSIIDIDDSNILHEDINKLPKNKQYMNDKTETNMKTVMKPSRFFNVTNSFAETVKEYTGIVIGLHLHLDISNKRYEEDECLGDIAKKVTLTDLLGFDPFAETVEDLTDEKENKII